MAGKNFTRQNGDENAQSARELASKKSCVRLSCVRHRSDNPNRARECDRLESLARPHPASPHVRLRCTWLVRVNSTRGEAGWADSGPFWRSLPNSYLSTSSKNLSSPKKSPQIGYTKSCYFLILSKMRYTNFFDKNMTF